MWERFGNRLDEEFEIVVGGARCEAVDTVCFWDRSHDLDFEISLQSDEKRGLAILLRRDET